MEKRNCYKAQAHDWLTTLYGNSDNFNWAQAGLPKDKVTCTVNQSNLI